MPNKKELKNLNKPKPAQSFEQMVSDASLAKMKPFIQQEVVRVSQLMIQEQMGNFQSIFERLTALEKLVMEKTGVSDEEYVSRVTDVQDQFQGVKRLDRAAQAGDILRVEVSTKAKDQEDYQGTSRMMIASLGSGTSIGKELEEQLIGLKAGEEKVLEFGKDKLLVAKIVINRVSGKEE